MLAIALSAIFLLLNGLMFVPAHQGFDQNGYLVGGKLLAQNGSMAYRTVNINTGEQDPLLYVGNMWVGFDFDTAEQRYYPKYPIGLPAIVATVFRITGPDRGARLAYWISPVCMSLALLAVFFLVRLVAHPLLALMACALMFTNPLVLKLTNDPGSHAADLLCVAWGMYFLFKWWHKQGVARAVAAGLLLGYAATIRYTEALLLLPILLIVVIAYSAGKAPTRLTLQSSILLLSWAAPVLALLTHNIIAFNSFTGYDTTNESSGFALRYFVNNWDTTYRQINETVLVFILPLSLAGLIAMFWWSWRLALVLASWIIPTTLVYTAFYWAPDSSSYARFFLTIVPAFFMCAFWFLNHIRFPVPDGIGGANNPAPDASLQQAQSPFSIPGPAPLTLPSLAIAGLMTLVTITVSLTQALPEAALDYSNRTRLHDASSRIRQIATPGSVIVSQDKTILNHLQFVSDFQLYSLKLFEKGSVEKLPVRDPGAPQSRQAQQRQALYEHLKDLSQQDLDHKLKDIIRNALEHGQDAFFIKREEHPAQHALSRPSSAPGLRTPSLAVPLISPGIAPPEEFSTRVEFTWLPAESRLSRNRLDLEKRRKNPPVQLAWQLIRITALPDQAGTTSVP